jgi:hypothetical protein
MALLIATCLILAIRTAKWAARASDSTASDTDLDREIEHARISLDECSPGSFQNTIQFFRMRRSPGTNRTERMSRNNLLRLL